MKKFFFIIVFLSCFAFLQGETDYLSSVDVENFDTEKRIEYFYNKAGQRTMQFDRAKSGTEFANDVYTYWIFSDNKCLSEIRQTWQNGEYVNIQKIDFEYFNNKITKKTTKIWENGAWQNSLQETNTFSNENLISNTQQTWQNDAWLNQIKTEFEYSNNKISKITVLLFSSNQWINNRKIEISANEEILYLWNGVGWIADEKTLYFYNNNLLELEEKQVWNNEMWKKKLRFEYKYNTDGKILSQENSIWNGFWQQNLKINYNYENGKLLEKIYFSWVYNMWQSACTDTYSYDSKNRQTVIETQTLFWGTSENFAKHIPLSAEIFYGNRATAAYKPLSEIIREPEINENDLPAYEFLVYPNPSVDGIYNISTSLSVKDINIVSIDGKILKTFKSSNQINLQSLKSGMYIMKTDTNKSTFINKLILIK